MQNFQRGRVARDLLTEFLELSANKQRLKTWLSQALIGDYPDNIAIAAATNHDLIAAKISFVSKKSASLGR